MMDILTPRSLRVVLRAAFALAKLPILAAGRLFRLTLRLAGALTLMRSDELTCAGCGNAVSLVGRYQCGRCNCVFDGYAFRACPVCKSIPPYVPCIRCGVSLRNPMPSERTR